MTQHQYFATCAKGIEKILADELRTIGVQDIKQGRGGVYFAGDRALLYRANLWLRTAVRVLCPILEARVTSPDELYAAVQTIDWQQYLTPDHTLAVDCNVRDSALTHSKYAALRVKDAICDQFVDKVGKRPNVDVEQPMLALNLHVHLNKAILSLDSSWDSLHKRGYRPILTRAPINEALAAALVQLTGWTGETALVDPLCGSGTLLIEGAWLAMKRPPGLTRKHFGFMGWMDFDIALWAELREEARREMLRTHPPTISGSDLRLDALSLAERNAKAAGVGHAISLQRLDVRELRLPTKPGIVVCNPPYGERIGEEKDLMSLYRALGDLAGRSPGWAVWIFTGNPRLAAAVGRPARQEIALFNGKIPCRFLRFSAD